MITANAYRVCRSGLASCTRHTEESRLRLSRRPLYPVPRDEAARQRDVDRLHPRPAENLALDEIAAAAAAVVGASVGVVTIIDREMLEVAGRFNIGVREIARAESVCAHAIMRPGEILCVPDLRAEERFAGLEIARGETAIRFYAGAPILSRGQRPLGMLCVIDNECRADLTDPQRRALRRLAHVAADRLQRPLPDRDLGVCDAAALI